MGLERWLPGSEAERFARFLATTIQGLSVQARDGVDEAALRDVAVIAAAEMVAATDADVRPPNGDCRCRACVSGGRSPDARDGPADGRPPSRPS